MVLDDWCFCPVSKCPALFSAYKRYIEEERAALEPGAPVLDPVMGKPVDSSLLKLSSPDEATRYIQVYNNVLPEKKKGGDGDDDDDAADAGAAGNASGSGSAATGESKSSSPDGKPDTKSKSQDKERERRERRERSKARRG